VVERAEGSGVSRILTVGLDEDSNREAISISRAHDGVFAAVGRHPNSAAGFDAKAEADLLQLASDPEVKAIGETGLDFYRDRASRDDQVAAFRAQMRVAREVSKPLVIHMRSGRAQAMMPSPTRSLSSHPRLKA